MRGSLGPFSSCSLLEFSGMGPRFTVLGTFYLRWLMIGLLGLGQGAHQICLRQLLGRWWKWPELWRETDMLTCTQPSRRSPAVCICKCSHRRAMKSLAALKYRHLIMINSFLHLWFMTLKRKQGKEKKKKTLGRESLVWSKLCLFKDYAYFAWFLCHYNVQGRKKVGTV